MFPRKRSALPLVKLLKSAIANAKNNFQLDPENLYVKEFKIDEAPTFKTLYAESQRKSNHHKKKKAHVSLVLGEMKAKAKNKSKRKNNKKKSKYQINFNLL